MTAKWFLWLVAALIGSAVAFTPATFAATKDSKKAEKAAAQPCAPAPKMEEKKSEKAAAEGEKKPAKKAGKKKPEKGTK
jgi:hypothetical protein